MLSNPKAMVTILALMMLLTVNGRAEVGAISQDNPAGVDTLVDIGRFVIPEMDPDWIMGNIVYWDPSAEKWDRSDIIPKDIKDQIKITYFADSSAPAFQDVVDGKGVADIDVLSQLQISVGDEQRLEVTINKVFKFDVPRFAENPQYKTVLMDETKKLMARGAEKVLWVGQGFYCSSTTRTFVKFSGRETMGLPYLSISGERYRAKDTSVSSGFIGCYPIDLTKEVPKGAGKESYGGINQRLMKMDPFQGMIDDDIRDLFTPGPFQDALEIPRPPKDQDHSHQPEDF